VAIHQIQSQKCVLIVQRRGSRLRGWHRPLAAVEEQVLDLRRSGQQHLVDGKVTQGLPLLAKRTQRRDQRGEIARDRGKVGRGHSEVPVGELLLRPARPGSGELHMTDCWMVRNELDRCTREIRHDLIVAPRGCFRLEGAARSGYAARCSLSLDALAPSPLPLRGGRKSAHSAVSKT